MIGRMGKIVLAALALATPAMAAGPTMPGWLSGCWAEQKGPNWTEECWSGPRGGIMLGGGRNGRGEELRSWESMQIEQAPDGKLTFYAAQKGAARVGFPAETVGAREIVFVNREHDYPQRIRYWREGMDLIAEIGLADGSKASRWHYKRLMR
jgi:hypothetical protein